MGSSYKGVSRRRRVTRPRVEQRLGDRDGDCVGARVRPEARPRVREMQADGLVAAAAGGLAAARVAGNPFAGWWPSLAAIAVPWLLVTFPVLLQTPCPPDHPPLTPTYNCVPPGAPIFFAASALGIALAVWGAWCDLRRTYPLAAQHRPS